ncbi:MAG: hypothetical protein CMN75_00420 [Spirochaeta sp.]|nr:hypothetical protein [Spirochaeta sp.]RPG08115.1 MAG: hypothetical protein CBC32_008380 [Proteobacteria bacterium TMED72]
MATVQNGAHATKTEAERVRVEELTKRIEMISALDEDELGGWTRMDWVLITVLGIVGPLVVLYGFAP